MLFGTARFRSAYRRRELSPVEAVEAQLAYAGEVSDKVNAISQISPTAIDEARESERRWAAGCPIGPLDGVPVVVKDSYHIAGMKRWHGSAIHNGDAPSTGTSEPIARLREAGGIVVAKTTMPDMGMLGSGISSQFGIVRNPWDTTVSPGGSSAGVGASLACGLGAFGLGTDIAGSVRLPAAHCGLAAIKPTQGRIAYSPASTMRSSGVMGRSVSDVVEGLLAVGKQAPTDPMCLPGAFRATAFEEVLQRLPRAGLLLDVGYGTPTDPVVAAATQTAAARLEAAGFAVESVSLGLGEADFANADLVFKAHAAAEVRASRHPEAALDLVGRWLEGADAIPMADYEDAMCGLLATVAKIEQAAGSFDFLISPVIPTLPFAADSPGPGDECCCTTRTTRPGSTKPASRRRCGANDAATNLPIGVQVAARRFDDAGALAVAGYRPRAQPFPRSPRSRRCPHMNVTPWAARRQAGARRQHRHRRRVRAPGDRCGKPPVTSAWQWVAPMTCDITPSWVVRRKASARRQRVVSQTRTPCTHRRSRIVTVMRAAGRPASHPRSWSRRQRRHQRAQLPRPGAARLDELRDTRLLLHALDARRAVHELDLGRNAHLRPRRCAPW